MAKPRPPTFEAVDLNAIVKQTMDLERPQCSVANIKLVGDFEADLPRVTADPHRLGQVLMNLLGNARQAMEASEKGPDPDRPHPAARRDGGDPRDRRRPGHPARIEGEDLRLVLHDQAPRRGHGAWGSRSRARSSRPHGGNLRLDDTPGGGATLHPELPAGAPRTEAVTPS